jgi:rhodanese-related sulfurtransferase
MRKTGITLILVSLFLFTQCMASDLALTTISPDEAVKLIETYDGDTGFVILDIRTKKEFQQGHIKNAVMIDYYSANFLNEMKKLDKSKTYLMYCRSGNRSGKALQQIKDLGFNRVYNMGTGVNGWNAKGYPLVR